jgi:hypothetical protein
MKNLTSITVVAVWFAVALGVAFGLQNPEMFEGSSVNVVGHGVSGSISTLTSILCMAVPFVALGITTVVGFVFHKETENKKAIA